MTPKVSSADKLTTGYMLYTRSATPLVGLLCARRGQSIVSPRLIEVKF